jgi:hypothetical protein
MAEKIESDKSETFNSSSAISTESVSSPGREKRKTNWRYWITAWVSILFWMAIFWATIPVYLQLHSISIWRVGLSGYGFELDPTGLQSFSQFNYVGYSLDSGEPTAAAMWVEIIFWSYLGVVASQVYHITQLISKDTYEFKASRYFIRTFGIIVPGVSLATIIIFLLRIVTLTIGPVEVSLKRADIQTIISISFIAGFYNEDTERLLRRLWRQTSQTIGKKSDQEKDGES